MKLGKVYEEATASVTLRWLGRALDCVFPVSCLACNRPSEGEGRTIGLCIRCRGRLARWPSLTCAVCGLPLGSRPPTPGYRCRSCRHQLPPYTALLAGWRYRPPLDAVVAALKFRRLDYLGPNLGRLAAVALRDRMPDDAVVVPVPLHVLRRMRRGFDQAALIARGLASHCGWPAILALRRRRSTMAQTRLERAQRLTNPRGAFALASRRCARRVKGRDVVLVDDVVTTGATVAAAARALSQAGVRSVTVVAVARTPLPGEP